MEVLCSLPRTPLTATVNDIARDMTMPADAVRRLLAKLKGLGYQLTEQVHDGYSVAAIADDGWVQAKRNGRKYWNKVYGGYSAAG